MRGPGLIVLSTLLAGCSIQFEGPAPPLGALKEPVALAALPGQCHVLVSNGNFSLKDRGGSVVVADVATREIVAGAGVEIGSFSGQLRVHPNGKVGYVTVRGDDSITWFDVTQPDAAPPRLSCGGSERCGDADRLPSTPADDDLTEPLGLELLCAWDGQRCGSDDVPVGLVATWLRSGAVTFHPLFSKDQVGGSAGVPETGLDATRLTEWGLLDEPYTIPGVSGLARDPDGKHVYVTSTGGDALYRFGIRRVDKEVEGKVERVWAAEVDDRAALVGGTHDGRDTDLRGLAVAPDGHRIFVAAEHRYSRMGAPSELIAVDTPTDAYGRPDLSVAGVVPLEGRAGIVRYLERDDGTDLVYVAVFGADRLVAVDALTLDVVGVVDLGTDPFDLELVMVPEEGACPREDGKRRMEAWITEFGANRVAVVDIDPASDTYHQVVAHVH